MPLLAGVRRGLTTFAPGIFLIGYTIGTGSVTTMAAAGARFGMSLVWLLVLSCVFSFVMNVAFGRYTLITGETALWGFRRHLGTPMALFVMVGAYVSLVGAIMGVMGVVGDVVQEWSRPLTASGAGIHPVYTTVGTMGSLYYLFWTGRHSRFEQVLAVMVGVMGVAFFLSMVLVIPDPWTVIAGMVPRIPTGESPHLVGAGMVGTTLATVVLLSRGIMVAEKGWGIPDLGLQQRDAAVGASLTFLLSAAIMACCAGALYPRGIVVHEAMEIVGALEPLAGRLAVTVFVVGIIAAGWSSNFPNCVLTGWLITDILHQPRTMRRPLLRGVVLAAMLTGFYVPLFQVRPVPLMIASQAFGAAVLPVTVLGITYLTNSRRAVGEHRNGLWLNIGCGAAAVFSMVACYLGLVGLREYFQ